MSLTIPNSEVPRGDAGVGGIDALGTSEDEKVEQSTDVNRCQQVDSSR